MRKVILFMHLSLDGFIGGINGEMDWTTMDDDDIGQYFITDLLKTVDTMLLGRVLYKGFKQAWPARAIDPSTSEGEVEFAHWVEDSPKIVFTTTLENVEWNNSRAVLVNDDNDIAAEVAKLKRESGKDMGSSAMRTLLRPLTASA